MNEPHPPPKDRAWPSLIAASATQFAAGFGFWTFGLLAPELAAETGLDPRDFGLSITFTFAGALLASLFTGSLAHRYGGAGAIARLFAVMIAAMALTLSGSWAGVMAAAFLFGVGYGPQGPIGMTLVAQTAQSKHRGLFLALRHAMVPLAASIAGRVLPPLMLFAGWQAGVFSVGAVLSLALLLTLAVPAPFAVQTTRPDHASLTGRLARIFSIPRGLRTLWAAGMGFAVTQTAVTAFAYLYLLEVAGASKIAAGLFVSNLHLTALFGRPALGWLTDRIGNPMLVLAGIAATTVVAMLALRHVGPETPTIALIPLAMACGVSAQCWNSVFVSAMSFRVAPEDMAELNGRAFAFLSIGWMAAPPAFWGLIEITGGYDAPILAVAALNVVLALALIAGRRR